jgi:hypothetical protein
MAIGHVLAQGQPQRHELGPSNRPPSCWFNGRGSTGEMADAVSLNYDKHRGAGWDIDERSRCYTPD